VDWSIQVQAPGTQSLLSREAMTADKPKVGFLICCSITCSGNYTWLVAENNGCPHTALPGLPVGGMRWCIRVHPLQLGVGKDLDLISALSLISCVSRVCPVSSAAPAHLRQYGGKSISQSACVWIHSFTLTSCVTPGKLLNLSVPCFSICETRITAPIFQSCSRS
jgi:hypothetical protein